MSRSRYLMIHRDHPITVRGSNGGAEMATLALARALVRAGHEVTVCAMLKDGACEVDGVRFWDLGPSYDVASAVRRAAAEGEFYLLSSGHVLPIVICSTEPKCLARIVISHSRAAADAGIRADVLARLADHVVCVSKAQRDTIIELGADHEKLSVVYNGVDQEIFRPGSAEGRDPWKLVFAGALVPDKGLHLLLQAYGELKGAFPKLTLDVYGSAGLWGREPYLDERAIAQQFPGVTFFGAVDSPIVARAFAKASLCIFPSIWFESFPLSSIEAQVCGCPVIGFEVGGVPEGIQHGETGVVIKEITAQALATELHRLLSNPSEITRMSQRCLELTPSRFRWERVVTEIEAITHSVAKPSAEQKDNDTQKIARARVGLVTTWNQRCGLARYARNLFAQFPDGALTIFAEDVPTEQRTADDEENVIRSWTKGGDFARIESSLDQLNIGLLHLNFHDHTFADTAQTVAFLRRVRARGIRTVSHLHTTFTVSEGMRDYLKELDCVVALSPEARLQIIANGARPEQVVVLPIGVTSRESVSGQTRETARTAWGVGKEERLIISHGFIQPSKGMEGVIDAVAASTRAGIPSRGVIAGLINPAHPQAQQYAQALKQYAEQCGVADRVKIVDSFLSDEQYDSLRDAADLIILNYQAAYYEASAAVCDAIGAGAIVLTSLAPAFSPFGDAVWHATAGFPIGESARLILSNPILADTIREAARSYAQHNSWDEVRAQLSKFYRTMQFEPSGKRKEIVVTSQPTHRILFQNRANALTQRGGDTVVMEKLARALEAQGVHVTIDVDGRCDPARFDLVHLFNFATPDLTRSLAERAHAVGTPFVVTTLCEDLPAFHVQSLSAARSLVEYVRNGQQRAPLAAAEKGWKQGQRCPSFDNSWTVQNAAALFTCGASESAVLRRDYPKVSSIVEIPFGCDALPSADSQLFTREYGVRDFVLCVGRLESRKNQLMLLRALEDSEIPVVLAGGGFSYQPEYETAVRNFKRRGKTVVVGKLSDELLASAYAAARVHALPSWYELPGLVSLEAASLGKSVVIGDLGAATDYLGDYAFSCDPGNIQSVRNAVLAAYFSPPTPEIAVSARSYTWERCAKQTLAAYRTVIQPRVEISSPRVEERPAPQPQIDAQAFHSPNVQPVVVPQGEGNAIVDEAERVARTGNFAEAHLLLDKAEQGGPSARSLQVRGTILIAEDKPEQARAILERAVTLDPCSAKALASLGLCEMGRNRCKEAYSWFVRALDQDPHQLVAIMQLLKCSYVLGQFEDLERYLDAYVRSHPEDLEMQYCLAGCLYKRGKLDQARTVNNRVLATKSEHAGAKQLDDVLQEAARQAQPQPTTSPTVTAPVAPAVEPVKQPMASQSFAERSEQDMRVGASTPMVPTSIVTALDSHIWSIEDKKRSAKYDEVRNETDKLLQAGGLSADQFETVAALRAEVGVIAGDLAGATRLYDQIEGRNPRSARMLCGRGALAANSGDWATAQAYFERAQRERPDYDVPLAGLGLCASVQRKHEVAWEYYIKALQVNPENSRALLGIIELAYMLKRLPQLEIALTNYLDMHPASLDFLYALAGCYFGQGKLDEAYSEVSKITLLNPEHNRARELQKMIDERRSGGNSREYSIAG